MIIVNFTGNSNYTYAYGLWQWDYGQVLRIQGLSLPSAVEIHFSLQETGGEATPRIGVTKDGVTDVVIPDSMLEGNNATANYNIYVFIYLTDDTSGETIKKIKLNVNARPKPEGRSGDDTTTMAAILKAVNEIADAKVTVVDKELSKESANPVENKVVTEELSKLSLEMANKLTAPETAEVGQTIVVSAVDENGKPTAWKVADMASGGSEKWELLASVETTEVTTSIVLDIPESRYKKIRTHISTVGASESKVNAATLALCYKTNDEFLNLIWAQGLINTSDGVRCVTGLESDLTERGAFTFGTSCRHTGLSNFYEAQIGYGSAGGGGGYSFRPDLTLDTIVQGFEIHSAAIGGAIGIDTKIYIWGVKA